MQLSNIPGKLVIPFANAGGKNPIPVASQIGITAGAASLTDGFPPLTMTPLAAGGVPPSGLDMNGILYEMSNILRWANAGGGYSYDSTFATDINVGGYPKGARVMRSDGQGYWFNTVDNNTSDPEAVGAELAGWVPDYQAGATAVVMSGSSVTLSPAQYGKKLLVLTGAISANLNLILPAIAREWIILNNTTGGYSVTAKTATGNGVKLGTAGVVFSDGTNVYSGANVNQVSVTNYEAAGFDQATAVQMAINQAALTGGVVNFDQSKVYSVSTLTPKSNVILNLNGSTLKLKNGVNERIFVGSGGVNFAVINGTLDGNMANNAGYYNLSGASTFDNWDGLIFQNITWQNIYRTSLSITGTTKNLLLENIKHVNCGQANGFGMYAYALECWPGTSRIFIRNFGVSNHYGYGIHFYGCTDFEVDNASFATLNYGTSSIAITLTQAARGRITNFSCNGVVGDNLEINAVTDLVVENVNIVSAGGRPLLMGDNSTGVWNERVSIRNFKCTSTGASYSLVLNYIKRCKFELFDCDKSLDTTVVGNPANDRNNVLEDCVFAANISSAFVYYRKFHMKRVSFLNFYVHDHDGPISTFSCPQTAGAFQISVPTGTTIYVDLNAFDSLLNMGFVNGRLRVTSAFNNSQGSYQECLFLASNNNTTLNLSTVTQVNNATERAMTIAADAANRRIALTNSTGVTLNVWWTVELHKADY